MPARLKALVASLAIGCLLAAMPAVASADVPHVVLPGETLTSVAATDGLSVAAVAAANGLSPTAELIIGQVLEIPPLNAYTAAPVSTTATHVGSSPSREVVTSTTNASSSTTDASSDADADADAASDTTDAATSTATTSTATTAHPVTTTATATTTSPTSTTTTAADVGPLPTPERVSGAEIAQIADADGVPPGLAEGVAWQESGWNNDVVSGIGAVGVMQIVPSTWAWINQYLTPSQPLQPASAAENVRAGVLLLQDLLVVTGNDEPLAVASYYQGLASVRSHGMYADTKQYVADVMALAGRFGG
jgi:murein DD-endopeptidase MepM/ murein hydrolase activator NlpD